MTCARGVCFWDLTGFSPWFGSTKRVSRQWRGPLVAGMQRVAGGHGWSPCWSCRASRVCSSCSRTYHHRGHDRHVPVGFAVVSQGSTMVRFQQACFLSVARPSISQGSAMVWFHLSVSGPVRSGNERVAEGTGWLPCWSCRLAPGWICSSLSNVSPPWTWISMCPWGSVPASVVGLVVVNHGSISRRDRVPGREQHHFAISGGG